MKRKIFATLTLLLLSSAPAFAGQFGAAVAQTKPGQFSLGAGAHYYNDEWEFAGNRTITTDVRQTLAFVQLNFGLFPGWEAYAKGGAADLRADEILAGADLRSDFAAFGTAGLKGLLRRGKYFDLGVFLEGSYFTKLNDRSDAGARMSIIDHFVVNTGLTFQKEIEGALLYGGPFFHYRQADFSSSGITFTDGTSLGSGDVEDASNIGGFIGIRWVALGDIVIETELQVRDNVSAGAAVSFLF